MKTVNDIREYFKNELKEERFTTDKTGAQTIEMIGASFLADEPSIFGTPSEKYIAAELAWYESGSTNVNDIYGPERDAPAAWKYAADKHGNINSNYGHLIFSKKYHSQFANAAKELIDNPDSRRAMMVYNRPSIWAEYDENGKSDFICTNAVSYAIRDNKLHVVVQMRSNDVVFGYKNDYAWARYVQDKLVRKINRHHRTFSDAWTVGQTLALTAGDITWQVMNLHCYERHFHLVKS
jgi:thymidylate synthase